MYNQVSLIRPGSVQLIGNWFY